MGHQDGDGRCVPGPGGQVEWAVSTMVPQIHLEAVRLHMLGQPGHQIDLRSVARERERKKERIIMTLQKAKKGKVNWR